MGHRILEAEHIIDTAELHAEGTLAVRSIVDCNHCIDSVVVHCFVSFVSHAFHYIVCIVNCQEQKEIISERIIKIVSLPQKMVRSVMVFFIVFSLSLTLSFYYIYRHITTPFSNNSQIKQE